MAITLNHSLQAIVNIAVEVLHPHKIVLLGYINKAGQSISLLHHRLHDNNDMAALIIAIIISNDCNDKKYKLNSIEDRSKNHLPTTCVLLTTVSLKSLTEGGNEFAIRVQLSANILYQQWQAAPHILKSIQEITLKPLDQTDLFVWYRRAHLFHQTASLHQLLGNYLMTAFCMHQATEQLLHMLIISAIGYGVVSHNLDRLLRILRFFNSRSNEIFVKTTDEPTNRLHLLNTTYKNFRYRNEDNVTEKDTRYFLQEYEKLLAVADEIILQQHPSQQT
ncbi:MAG: HEPN domain-containing protein [Pseudobacter sp.]|uniref:HEPN domain-containing protein n=1 Tax=Pseudobacter sp. TaxID=2045420 RepID=UPI003F81BCC3